MRERKVTLRFLVISCKTAFKGILGRSFLVKLDGIEFPVHLEVTYHNMEGKSIVVMADLEEEKWIKEIILKDILASSAGEK